MRVTSGYEQSAACVQPAKCKPTSHRKTRSFPNGTSDIISFQSNPYVGLSKQHWALFLLILKRGFFDSIRFDESGNLFCNLLAKQ